MARQSKIPVPKQRSLVANGTTSVPVAASEVSSLIPLPHHSLLATGSRSPLPLPPKTSTTKRQQRPSRLPNRKVVPPDTPCSASTAPTESMFSDPSFDSPHDLTMTTPIQSAAASVQNSSTCASSQSLHSRNLKCKLDLLEQKWRISSVPKQKTNKSALFKAAATTHTPPRPLQGTPPLISSSAASDAAPVTPKPQTPMMRDPHGMVELSPLSMYSVGGGDDVDFLDGCPPLPHEPQSVYDRLYPFASPPSTPNLNRPRGSAIRTSRIPVFPSPPTFQSRVTSSSSSSHPTRIPPPKIFSPISQPITSVKQLHASSSLALPKVQGFSSKPVTTICSSLVSVNLTSFDPRDPQLEVLYEVQRRSPRKYHRASGVVQRWWRGSLMRSRRPKLPSDKADETGKVRVASFPLGFTILPDDAAMCLQTAWRRHHAQHDWVAFKWAAVTIQTQVRAHQVQKRYQRYLKATHQVLPIVQQRRSLPVEDDDDEVADAASCSAAHQGNNASWSEESHNNRQVLREEMGQPLLVGLEKQAGFMKYPKELQAELQGLSATYVREFLLKFLEGAKFYPKNDLKETPQDQSFDVSKTVSRTANDRSMNTATLVLPTSLWKFSKLRRLSSVLLETNLNVQMRNLAACKIQSVVRGRFARERYYNALVQRERELFGMDKEWEASNEETPSLGNESRNPRPELDESSASGCNGNTCRHIYGGKTLRSASESPTESTQNDDASSYTPMHSTAAAKAGASEIVQQAFSTLISLERRNELVLLFRRQKDKVLSSKQELQLIDHTIRKSIVPLQRRWRRLNGVKNEPVVNIGTSMRVDVKEKDVYAAVCIQRWYRGVTERLKYKVLLQETARRKSACKILSFVRGARVRNEMKEQLACASELATAEREWNAACRIQRFMRRTCDHRRKKKGRESYAATIIGTWLRTVCRRASYRRDQKQIAMASLIQSSFRGYSQRQRYKRLLFRENQSANTCTAKSLDVAEGLESACKRGLPAKSKIKTLLKGSHFRSLERIHKRNSACLKIQAAYRGSQCRRAFKQQIADKPRPKLPERTAKQPLGISSTHNSSMHAKVIQPPIVRGAARSDPMSKPGYLFAKKPAIQPLGVSSTPNIGTQAKVSRLLAAAHTLPISHAKIRCHSTQKISVSPPFPYEVQVGVVASPLSPVDVDSRDQICAKSLQPGGKPAQNLVPKVTMPKQPVLKSKRPLSTLTTKKQTLFISSPTKRVGPVSASDPSVIDLCAIFRRAYAVHRAKRWGGNATRNAAAQRLQRWWRIYCMLAIYICRRRGAAIVIQTNYRGYCCTKLSRKRCRSLIAIQRWTRSTLALRRKRQQMSTQQIVVAVLQMSVLVLLLVFVLFLVTALIWCEPVRETFSDLNVRIVCDV